MVQSPIMLTIFAHLIVHMCVISLYMVQYTCKGGSIVWGGNEERECEVLPGGVDLVVVDLGFGMEASLRGLKCHGWIEVPDLWCTRLVLFIGNLKGSEVFSPADVKRDVRRRGIARQCLERHLESYS